MSNCIFKLRNNNLFKMGVFFAFAILLFFCFETYIASAADADMKKNLDSAAGENGANFGEATDPRLIIAFVVKVFLSMLGILFLVYTIYAGYLVMFSAGDEERVNKGKSTLRTSVLGLLVVFSGYGMLLLLSEVVFKAQEEPNDGFNLEYDLNVRNYDNCIRGGGDPVSCKR